MRNYLFVLAAYLGSLAAPASANWDVASPLIDGACSVGTVNADGVIASAVMDRDESVRLVIGIRGGRATMFVVNFSDGTNEVFQASSNNNLSFTLTPETLAAFRDSDSFRLYESDRGFFTPPFALSGSSRAIDSLYDCVGKIRLKEAEADVGQNGKPIPTLSVFGVEIGMTQPEVVESLERAKFETRWSDLTSTLNAEGPNGEDMTVYFRQRAEPLTVKKFFVVISGADTDVSQIPTEIQNKYGQHSAVHSFSGHKTWYRTSAGESLKEVREQYPCPSSAKSRLVLRETKAGNDYMSGAGGSIKAANNKYEIAIDDCSGD